MVGPIWQDKPEGEMTGFLQYVGYDIGKPRSEAAVTQIWEGNQLVNEKIEQHCGGKASSSECPRLSLIPQEAMTRLAERMGLGIKNHGERSWNALSTNQEILTDKDFLLTRLDHVIRHAMELAAKVAEAKRTGVFTMGDDDAAAILWAGAYFTCATKAICDEQASLDLANVGRDEAQHEAEKLRKERILAAFGMTEATPAPHPKYALKSIEVPTHVTKLQHSVTAERSIDATLELEPPPWAVDADWVARHQGDPRGDDKVAPLTDEIRRQMRENQERDLAEAHETEGTPPEAQS